MVFRPEDAAVGRIYAGICFVLTAKPFFGDKGSRAALSRLGVGAANFVFSGVTSFLGATFSLFSSSESFEKSFETDIV